MIGSLSLSDISIKFLRDAEIRLSTYICRCLFITGKKNMNSDGFTVIVFEVNKSIFPSLALMAIAYSLPFDIPVSV